jgi:hypothetical protein
MNRRKKYGTVYPRQAIVLPDGTIHEKCTVCYGKGKEQIYTHSTNDPGGSESKYTRNPCRNCDGMGYEYTPIKLIKIEDWKR